MAIKDKAFNLFSYINHVYSIDLPVIRSFEDYKQEAWWQADLTQSAQCGIKQFDVYAEEADSEISNASQPWLTVTKKWYDNPPDLSPRLKSWVNVPLNPFKHPSATPSLPKIILFADDAERVKAFDEYVQAWQKWKEQAEVFPVVPGILEEWLDKRHPSIEKPVALDSIKVEERFEDDPVRTSIFKAYLEGPWKDWSERVKPLYKANKFYDQLFTLHQKLSVEGDKKELIWGHLFLAWQYNSGVKIYHPLFVTSLSLIFDPTARQIHLVPSQTTTTKLEIDCLFDLEYPNKEQFTQFVRRLNNQAAEEPLDVWSNSQMRSLANAMTGLLSKEAAENTNLYKEAVVSKPSVSSKLTVHNAPVIFVRDRLRRLWVDDAKKVAEEINRGAQIPIFIRYLIAEPNSAEMPSFEGTPDSTEQEDGGELLLPLEYNDQQKEILQKLNRRFGALVQGPPGTGKSHTIANIVCSLLAKGKRVLVTSQTENALQVLRDYVPEQIRSLCVSHLGNDIEAKRQLTEAVDSIGKRLSEKGSLDAERKIQTLLKDIQATHEEQARLRNQIRDWVELGACKVVIDGEEISAVQAANECSESESAHSWFPDSVTHSVSPPLSHEELLHFCELLQSISSADREYCHQYLPAPQQLITPDQFQSRLKKLENCSLKADELETFREEWTDAFFQSPIEILEDAFSLIKDADLALQAISESWQQKILNLIATNQGQYDQWLEVFSKMRNFREKVSELFSAIQTHDIRYLQDIPKQIDVDVALDELLNYKPTSIMGRIRLSRQAKALFEIITVDGKDLTSNHRIEIARKHHQYTILLKNTSLLWEHTVKALDAPELDFSVGVPITEMDRKIKQLEAPFYWHKRFGSAIKEKTQLLGLTRSLSFDRTSLAWVLEAIYCQISACQKRQLCQELDTYQRFLISESEKAIAHGLWGILAETVQNRDHELYGHRYREVLRLNQLIEKVKEVDSLSGRLKKCAPLWSKSLEEKAVTTGIQALPTDWAKAWRWRQLDNWLKDIHNRESVESLQNRLEREKRKEKSLTTQLVVECTWQRQLINVKDHHYRALVAWADAMRKYGKGTGKYASKHLAAASRAMVEAVEAVPAWIMPLHRIIESFQPRANLFDVIIVDEASQCDIRALMVLYRGKKVLVVGDPEQISPSNVGIDLNKVYEAMRHYLSAIPYSETFDINNSLYEITKAIPRMDRTLLTEHFRCVPQIIEFNNALCPSYNGKLEPLRQPNPQERLDPPIETHFVPAGYKDDNDVNKSEAEALVAMLVKCCKDEKYAKGGKNNRKRTMGVISLLGEKQAKHIYELIAQHIDEAEREERKIICGDAYSFQGDERDVMFLSLVVAPNAPFAALVKDSDRQRFNVATSRARDQVFLFHSVRLSDIKNTNCVRYRLLDWYMNPIKTKFDHGKQVLREKADSPFEIEVGDRIIDRGYMVIPQHQPFHNDFNYRIDLVIQGLNNRVAVECDGDRYHGPERWEYDQRRELQLRRAGWKFWRISGSTFYRNKDKSLEGLWKFLEEEGVSPFATWYEDTAHREASSAPAAQDVPSCPQYQREESVQGVITASVSELDSDKTSSKVKEESQSPTITPAETAAIKVTIPPITYNPHVWRRIAAWCRETKLTHPYWADFADQLAKILQDGRRQISYKQKANMKKLWGIVFKKGFKLD